MFAAGETVEVKFQNQRGQADARPGIVIRQWGRDLETGALNYKVRLFDGREVVCRSYELRRKLTLWPHVS
jgi:hypothetical protein